MTHRAHQQLLVLNTLERTELTVAEAATLLGRSPRQVRRLHAAYRARGPAALVHSNQGHCGSTSQRRSGLEFCAHLRALTTLVSIGNASR